MKYALAFGLFACAATLGGCNKEATGQVAAVVNGDEITLQEVNGELESMGQIPEGADPKALQKTALERIIERRLLAQEAKKDGLDKSPEFLIRQRQLEDSLLVQLLGRNAARGSQVPSPKAVDAFIKSNPGAFSEHTVFGLDRIQFPMPAHPDQLKSLESAHTMDQVASQLQTLGIKFTRQPARMDSAQLGEQRLTQIRALPPGEPFIIAEGGAVTVASIVGEAKQPNAGDKARPMAAQAMRNKALIDTMQQRLKAARSEAKIDYQSGFAPLASPSTPAKSASKT